MLATYTFQRGETILLALDVIEGGAGPATPITARLEQEGTLTGSAELEATWRAAEGDTPAGWTLQMQPADYAHLPDGAYLADALIEHEGISIIADPVRVKITRSPSSPA